MVNTVKYLNAENTMVKVEPEGWTVPQPSRTWHQAVIDQWLEGRTDERDFQKLAYDEYMFIMGYDDAVITHEAELAQCQDDYSVCVDVGDLPITTCDRSLETCLLAVSHPIKPTGYYTQEQADDSVIVHDQWLVDKTAWESDPLNNGQDYPAREPQVLLIPVDLPVVVELSVLVPNTIEPYVKPVHEVRAEKISEVSASFKAEANADVISNGQVWNGGIEHALAINGDSELQAHRGRPQGTIHSKDHNAHTFNVSVLKDIASDIGEAYDIANVKLHIKLKEIETCGEDTACISAVSW